MKCVCGYEYLRKWELEEGQITGDECFIELDHPIIRAENKYFDGYRGDRMKDIQIYACPKCGTLKIEI